MRRAIGQPRPIRASIQLVGKSEGLESPFAFARAAKASEFAFDQLTRRNGLRLNRAAARAAQPMLGRRLFPTHSSFRPPNARARNCPGPISLRTADGLHPKAPADRFVRCRRRRREFHSVMLDERLDRHFEDGRHFILREFRPTPCSRRNCGLLEWAHAGDGPVPFLLSRVFQACVAKNPLASVFLRRVAPRPPQQHVVPPSLAAQGPTSQTEGLSALGDRFHEVDPP